MFKKLLKSFKDSLKLLRERNQDFDMFIMILMLGLGIKIIAYILVGLYFKIG